MSNDPDAAKNPSVAIEFTPHGHPDPAIQHTAIIPSVLDGFEFAFSRSVLETKLRRIGATEHTDLTGRDGVVGGAWSADAKVLRKLAERDHITAVIVAPLIEAMTPEASVDGESHPIHADIELWRDDNKKDNLLSGPTVELRLEPRHAEIAAGDDPVEIALREWLSDLEVNSIVTHPADPLTPGEETGMWGVDVDGVGQVILLSKPNTKRMEDIVDGLRDGHSMAVTIDDDLSGNCEVVTMPNDHTLEWAKRYVENNNPVAIHNKRLDEIARKSEMTR